jgi:hypothetical protein
VTVALAGALAVVAFGAAAATADAHGAASSGGKQPQQQDATRPAAQPTAVQPPPAGGQATVQPPGSFQAVTDTAGPAEFSLGAPPTHFSLRGFGVDCEGDLGAVRDPGPGRGVANFRLFGGVTINCDSVKSIISADVVEQYCTSNAAADCTDTSPNWLDATARTSGTLFNTRGSGTAILVTTSYICKGPYTWFRTASRMTIQPGGPVYDTFEVTSTPQELAGPNTGCTDASQL